MHPTARRLRPAGLAALLLCTSPMAAAQLTDIIQTPNLANSGIQHALAEQVGAGRGDVLTPKSSLFLIGRDPFRSIARGRQLFQRKFTGAQGLGPRLHDGIGDIHAAPGVGAGLADSCASCHGRPHGSAGVGGSVYTRPDGRDAPHLFGLGLKEMLADEITQELREIRVSARRAAIIGGTPITLPLVAKGIDFGSLTARPDGTLDTSAVVGVDADLRVRPFFAEGSTISIREFIVGAFKAEMGLEAADPDLLAAAAGADVTTPSGMVLSGSRDLIAAPPVAHPASDGDGDGVTDEVPTSLVDHLEFYLLNYFKPGRGPVDAETASGATLFGTIGCTECHVRDLPLRRDRRVADVETVFDPAQGNLFARLFATASPRFIVNDDGSGFPTLKTPSHAPFLVLDILTDLRRHDLGQAFHERNFDGSVTTMFMTTPLWGVGSTAPYGHDGRSATLEDVILRHGGEAQLARDSFEQLSAPDKGRILAFLGSLVLFAPPDTASNLAPAQPTHPQYPLIAHGSIDLSVLFNVPTERE
jgi:hypothetical protein